MDSPDEGLTLETSAFESVYGGHFTLLTQLINTQLLDEVEHDIMNYQDLGFDN